MTATTQSTGPQGPTLNTRLDAELKNLRTRLSRKVAAAKYEKQNKKKLDALSAQNKKVIARNEELEKIAKNAEDVLKKRIQDVLEIPAAPDAAYNFADYITAFKDGFVKKYNIPKRKHDDLDKAIAEKVLPREDKYFKDQDFKLSQVESACQTRLRLQYLPGEITLDLPQKGSTLKITPEELAEKYAKMLVKYGTAEELIAIGYNEDLEKRLTALKQKLKDRLDSADSSGLAATYLSEIQRVASDIGYSGLEGRTNLKKKDFDGLLKYMHGYMPRATENEMAKLLHVITKTKGISVIKRKNFYKRFINTKPKNDVLLGVALNNLGSLIMNHEKDDQKALKYFERAVRIARKDYALNPDPADDAAVRIDSYMNNLRACKRNIKKLPTPA